METTTVIVFSFFALAWYFGIKLKETEKKLDRVLLELNGLREYLYEIDPQFEDERAALELSEDSMFGGMDYLNLQKSKDNGGKRTLQTPFAREE